MSGVDIVVIGSGFAGASATAQLVRRGYKVTVIERGPWRTTPTGREIAGSRAVPFPRGARLLTHGLRSIGGLPLCGAQRRLLNRHGLFDYFVGEGLDVVGSSSVGGNSHVYGGISERPTDPSFWNNAGHGLSGAVMAPHYDEVERIMGVRTIAAEELGSAALARRFAATSGLQLGDNTTALPLAVNRAPTSDAARGRGGLLGCEDGSKTTTDAAFLARLVKTGDVRVRDLTEVHTLVPEGTRWRLRVRDLRSGAQTDITADKVILAGGAFNTLALLLAARQAGTRLPEAIGLGFGGNGDVAGLWLHDGPTDLTASFPTLQRVRLADAEKPLDIVEGAAPPPAFLPFSRLLCRRLSRSSLIAGMGPDAMDGHVSMNEGRLRLSYNASNSPIIAELQNAFDEIALRTGTRILKKKRLFTVHPSGGAAIGRVVDGKGEVQGANGLFIADASVFPRPLGSAPSLTIAAWGRHVASEI